MIYEHIVVLPQVDHRSEMVHNEVQDIWSLPQLYAEGYFNPEGPTMTTHYTCMVASHNLLKLQNQKSRKKYEIVGISN